MLSVSGRNVVPKPSGNTKLVMPLAATTLVSGPDTKLLSLAAVVAPASKVSDPVLVLNTPFVKVKALAICTGVYKDTPAVLSMASVTLLPNRIGTGIVAVLLMLWALVPFNVIREVPLGLTSVPLFMLMFP